MHRLILVTVIFVTACSAKQSQPDPTGESLVEPDAAAVAPVEDSPPEAEKPLLDLGARTWVSEPSAAEGGETVVTLLEIMPVPENKRDGLLEGAVAELEYRIFHPIMNSRICSLSSMSSCKGCALKSVELPAELDCTLAAGHEMEVARTVSFAQGDGEVLAVVDGRTGYKVPVPTRFTLRPTNGIRIAFGLLAGTTTGNQSSETAALKSLTGPLQDEADRRAGGARELEELLRERGVDPMTISVKRGLRLRDKMRDINMQSLRHPPVRPELIEDLLDREFPIEAP